MSNDLTAHSHEKVNRSLTIYFINIKITKMSKVKVRVMDYSHISKEGMILTGPFRTEEEAKRFDSEKVFGYYSHCKIEIVDTSKIYLFNGFKTEGAIQ